MAGPPSAGLTAVDPTAVDLNAVDPTAVGLTAAGRLRLQTLGGRSQQPTLGVVGRAWETLGRAACTQGAPLLQRQRWEGAAALATIQAPRAPAGAAPRSGG